MKLQNLIYFFCFYSLCVQAVDDEFEQIVYAPITKRCFALAALKAREEWFKIYYSFYSLSLSDERCVAIIQQKFVLHPSDNDNNIDFHIKLFGLGIDKEIVVSPEYIQEAFEEYRNPYTVSQVLLIIKKEMQKDSIDNK